MVILERIVKLSAAYGTHIEQREDRAIISLP